MLSYGRQLGLSPMEVTDALRLGRPLSDSNWCQAIDGAERYLSVAQEVFEAGRYLEYQCYDDRWQEQGRATVKLVSWEDRDAGLFMAEHVIASDAYYEYYGSTDLAQGCVYHLCAGRASGCKKKLSKGDRRTVVHVDRWRILTPQAMLETPYLKGLGKRLGREVMDNHRTGTQRPLGGTGLDETVEQMPLVPEAGAPAPEVKEKVKKKKEKDRGRSRTPKKARRLKEFVEAQEKRRHEEAPKKKSKSRKEKKRRSKEKNRRARGSDSDTSSSSRGSSSSSTLSLFQGTSARGGDLVRLAEKKPGRLTEMALQEMSKYLTSQGEANLEKGQWGSLRVLAYLNQIVLTNNPPAKIGIRAHRELVTLCTCLDLLMSGESVRCMDVLTQRLKAVEASVLDGNWNLARHYELIPPAGAQLSHESERELAQKREMRQQKLKEATQKMNRK